MRLTDEQLRCLVASNPNDAAARKELRDRIRWQAIRKLPNPAGVCSAGLRVYTDQKGAYSSGYIVHEQDHSVCDHWKEGVKWDEDSTSTKRLKALIARMRP